MLLKELTNEEFRTFSKNFNLKSIYQTVEYAFVMNKQNFDCVLLGLCDDSNNIVAASLFLIDKKGVVRHCVINDLPLGRSVDEAIRVVDALQHFEEFGEVCPANWSKGKTALKDTHEGVANYLSEQK